MSTRAASWLACSLCALSLTLTALGLLFHILNLSEPSVPTFAHWVESTLMGVGASTVGAIIASRRTHNPIGWLLCAAGLVFGAVMFAWEYAIYALLVAPGSLPAGEAMACGGSIWVLGFNFFVLMLILFPSGQLPRSRPYHTVSSDGRQSAVASLFDMRCHLLRDRLGLSVLAGRGPTSGLA
jgi:hypothetical protein